MNYNRHATATLNYVDFTTGLVLRQNVLNHPNDDNGKGDAIGRTFEALVSYGDPKLYVAIMQCWRRVYTNNHYVYKGVRYPKYEGRGISRDHLLNTVLAMLQVNRPKEEIREFVTHVPWKLSKDFSMTIDLWLWIRAMAGIWWAKPLSNVLEILLMIANVINNKFIYWVANFPQELHQKHFFIIPNEFKQKNWKKWSRRLFPSYTILQNAWKTYYMKPSLTRYILRKLLLTITGKHNYLSHVLLGKDVELSDVTSYLPMYGGRWDGILVPQINDRELFIISEENLHVSKETITWLLAANVLDVDILHSLWFKQYGVYKSSHSLDRQGNIISFPK